MNLAELSIKRPAFITCIILIMLALGAFSMQKLGVELFPDVTFPVVAITTPYPGAGPAEVETLVSKPLEDEISTLSGLKRLSSINQEGVSIVIAEFSLETDVKYAEQQIRDRVSSSKRKLPTDIKEPVIRRMDPADLPIMTFSVKADLPASELYDLANETIRPRLEQVNQVGLVEVTGGRKREIRVILDRNKLKSREISATQVAQRLAQAGENVPAGKVEEGNSETVFRTLGQFKSIKDIQSTIVSFFGNDVPTSIKDLGHVEDTLADENTRNYVNGNRSLFLDAFKQSGSNTIAVADGLLKKIKKINEELKSMPGKGHIEVVRDSSVFIRANVDDVKESILIGIVLAVVVVFFFLANGRSTIITGLALPNSLLGAFILMYVAGFSINTMSLLALSLSVGLLIDDAIVVRENIFRHIEMGKSPKEAALFGTAEVRLAVIATTMTVIAVFGPVGFLKGIVGQFFKQFGLTICFAMMISLFDALTIAPMLSAYFAGSMHPNTNSIWGRTVGKMLASFNRFQEGLENRYERILKYTLAHPLKVLGMSFIIFIICLASVAFTTRTFLPPQDNGEFSVSFDLPPGTSLEKTDALAKEMDAVIRSNKEVLISAVSVGKNDGSVNQGAMYVRLVPAKERKLNTSQVKDVIRKQFEKFAYANPKVSDYDAFGSGQRPFTLNILGFDQKQLEKIGLEVFEKLKKNPALKDVDVNFRTGKPEFQIVPNLSKMQMLGISSVNLGQELRAQIEGIIPAKFRQNGIEYDVRIRAEEDQRNLKKHFYSIYVPNINFNLIRLSDVAEGIETTGPSKITRQDRARYVQVGADITPGYGLGNVMAEIDKMFANDYKLPEGMRYAFIGQAESFQELGENMMMALLFGILFIYLVLTSLYESFITPFTIMLALPLAICGSFAALCITRQSLNIFSMIGTIMLLGVATKNSILLVDYANQLIRDGKSRADAILIAGKTRLRPILMTTMALIAGTLPVALGLNEASRQRTSMGVSIIGGLISSTLLTLVVVPAAYSYIDRFRVWSKKWMTKIFVSKEPEKA